MNGKTKRQIRESVKVYLTTIKSQLQSHSQQSKRIGDKKIQSQLMQIVKKLEQTIQTYEKQLGVF